MEFLNREKTIADINYNRWRVPIAALFIHLCIGQIYAFSVFNIPLTMLLGIDKSLPEDWKFTTVGWIFSIALFFLGASAALFGKWMEKNGPRKAMFVAALCFSLGFFISALGIKFHQIFLLYLGSGVIGGIGLGLGYISPVSTLIKWFPDKPGMATGMAIMGFGGGALIASPLSVFFMKLFSSTTSNGVFETFLVLGSIYLTLMMIGAYIVRVPQEGWKPNNYMEKISRNQNKEVKFNVLVDNAVKTRTFYLLFAVLMLNVTAGIGVLGQASVMIQELFSEKSVGAAKAINEWEAARFVMLLSFFNMLGRFAWSSFSDKIGRKTTYVIFFLLGAVLYSLIPSIGSSGNIVLFIATFAIIISMYGGGFATIPAYLRDVFGTENVGAIHGRLLLAWSAAALLGPMLVNYIRQYQIDVLQVPKAQAYFTTMYIMAGLLIIGLISNLLIKKVPERYHKN